MAADVMYEDRGSFDASNARSVELLQEQLDRFESLLVDLLEISRFDAGAAVLDVDRTDLVPMVERIIHATEPLAERNNLRVRFAAYERPAFVECDPRRIDRVIRNLVDNAIEHANGTDVVIELAGNPEAVAITVRDFGVGLMPGEASLVFSRFWRADKARARTTGGTGLGLAIALEDVRLHSGWLEAVGEPGAGACFRMTLPRIAGEAFNTSPLLMSEGFAENVNSGSESGVEELAMHTDLGARMRDPLDTAPWQRSGP
jgi:two-component system sensor histidine kinase MtrB